VSPAGSPKCVRPWIVSNTRLFSWWTRFHPLPPLIMSRTNGGWILRLDAPEGFDASPGLGSMGSARRPCRIEISEAAKSLLGLGAMIHINRSGFFPILLETNLSSVYAESPPYVDGRGSRKCVWPGINLRGGQPSRRPKHGSLSCSVAPREYRLLLTACYPQGYDCDAFRKLVLEKSVCPWGMPWKLAGKFSGSDIWVTSMI